MLFPLALLAASVLTPLVATTMLSLGLVASASALAQTRTQAAKPAHRVDRSLDASTLNELSLDLSRLHEELRLDVSQDTLWHKAEKAAWGNMRTVHTCLKRQHAETLALLAQPGADMRSIARCLEEFRSEEHKLCVANRERWLNVYDALSAKQKEQVRVFFKNRMEQADSEDVTQSLRTSAEAV